MSKLAAYTTAFFNHENYHGWFKQRRFFEGWYFKLVDKSEKHAFAFIPGIAMDTKGTRQSFVQVLDGKKITAEFHKYPAEDFHADEREFKISVSENYFSLEKMKLNLPGITGELNFSHHFLWPKKITSPGIMGWYSFVPFMECYHQVINMNYHIKGRLIINNNEIDFDGGRGYLEKDWGRSFPSSWVWMQSNHFEKDDVSFKLSVAKIPWLTGAFTGFISAFMLNGKLYRFATYTKASLKKLEISDHHISASIHDKNHILDVEAEQSAGADLATPVHGFMEGRVKESMSATISVTLSDKRSGELIFKGSGRNAGLEIAGKTNELLLH